FILKVIIPKIHFNSLFINTMEKKIINTTNAPAPIGPYNQAVLVNNTLYISGQVCIDPVSGSLKQRDIQEETHQVMHNLKAILAEAGMSFSNVVKTSIFLTDMNRFSEVNEIYGKYFEGDFPARETVQVSALPKFVNVEISMIAVP
ncbi:MAG TPA: RidA family protein, partial [Chitinophagaceae bacterium]|nr:RidA family protein [Chitinophagaceae bacterium]